MQTPDWNEDGVQTQSKINIIVENVDIVSAIDNETLFFFPWNSFVVFDWSTIQNTSIKEKSETSEINFVKIGEKINITQK